MGLPRLPVRVVLVRPRVPENLGAVARAMKNLGLDDWALVDPRTLDFAAARRVAVHAEDLLDRPKVVATLDEAVGDCVWVVGTSSRRVRGKRLLGPEAVAAEARGLEGRTAIVFGDERGGLANAEIGRCHDLSTIPADPAQPSLNLAQAVLLYGWELRRSAGVPTERVSGLASDRELGHLEAALRDTLRDGGFLRGPERHAVRDLTATLRRARLSAREARLWIAALKGAGRGRG